MFTGLVRALGVIKEASASGRGRRFKIDLQALAGKLEVGQSVAINGACLTVTSLSGSAGTFDAVMETVSRTNLGQLKPGDNVNLEPAVKAGDALDGHIMLGHVDVVAQILHIEVAPDARTIKVSLPASIRHLVAEKGSVAVDGISLTVSDAGSEWFSVSIIPHTWENSTLGQRRVGDRVNLEVDVLARYAARILQYSGKKMDEAFFKENGFA